MSFGLVGDVSMSSGVRIHGCLLSRWLSKGDTHKEIGGLVAWELDRKKLF